MSNNKRIDILKGQIEDMESQLKLENNPYAKIERIKVLIQAREEYTRLLRKKRPLLLTMALVFCIFYLISLFICLPPYIIRGSKIKINERRIQVLKKEMFELDAQYGYTNMYPNANNPYYNPALYNTNGQYNQYNQYQQ